MKKMFVLFNALDWLIATVSLVLGLIWGNGWLIGASIIGFAFAYIKPAEKLAHSLKKKLMRKRAPVEHTELMQAADAFYEQSNPAEERAEPAYYGRPVLPYKAALLSTNKHNKLGPESVGIGTRLTVSFH